MMTAILMAGLAGFSVGPSIATETPLLETAVLPESGDTGKMVSLLELANHPSTDTHRLLVQRKSSRPPGESRSGRASSNPAGIVPESGRESGRNLDPSEPPSPHEYDNTSEQKPSEPTVTPQKDGDSLEGGRKSQTPFKRRGGVVE